MNDTAALAQLFRERYDYFERMFEQGDIELMVNEFYTDNAVVEGFGMAPQVGKAAIAQAFKAAREGAFARIQIKMDSPAPSTGDVVYQFITNDNVALNGAVDVHRALIVWRHTANGWKCEVDFFCPKATG
jgi:ketosteroid isomerase-like protein